MANIKAAQSGNWSSTTTWQGGVLPGPDDIAIANSFTVTIDQDIAVQTLSNSTFGTSTAGGFFQITTVGDGVTRNATMSLGLGTTTYVGAVGGLLRISATSGTVDLGSTNIQGGSVSNFNALLISGSNTTVKTLGNVSTPSASTAQSILFASGANNCTLIVNNVETRGIRCQGFLNTVQANNVNSSTTGLTGSSIEVFATDSVIRANVATGGSANNTPAIASSGRGNQIYVDTVVGGPGVGQSSINLGSQNQLAVVREVYAGLRPGISLSSTNIQTRVIVTGAVFASSSSPAIVSSSFDAFLKIKGPYVDSAERCALQCVKFYPYETIGLQTSMNMYDSTGTALTLSTYHSDSPPPSDVRKGVEYGPNNQLVGTMSVPDPMSVVLGVPVDDTVGEAVLTGESVLESEISSGISIKTRINNIATISSTGEQLKAGVS